MAFTQFGDAKYLFSFKATGSAAVEAAAIETATGVAPQTLTISGEPEFVARAEGADGTVEGMAVADKKRTFTLEGYLTNKTVFDGVGLSFTHDGIFFIVTGSSLGKSTKEFQKATLSGEAYPGITAVTVVV